MLYMVIERFKNGNPKPIYQRFAQKGRMAPPDLTYVNSWVTEDGAVCFQVMECDNPALLNEWMSHWQDLVDFEVVPVVSSAEAALRFG